MVKTSTIIYAGHFFSSWGDRMWHFAVPLFLVDLEPTSLTLSAAYGLTLACAVLLFGPLVGDWIDKKPRLYCARISLIIQNAAVVLCAMLLLLNRIYGDNSKNYIIAVEIGAIVLGAVAQLASVATGIIIQKDWIVVVAGGKAEVLADLNSMVRRIDLASKILAPLACGFIMQAAELTGGAIFIMCWNVVSMVIEYVLLRSVYYRTPALAQKNIDQTTDEGEEMVELHNNQQLDPASENKEDVTSDTAVDNAPKSQKKPKKSRFTKLFGFVLTVKDGWKLYMAQPIALPCIGFSFLYMTILGFGYITTAYAFGQCFSELMVGMLMGGAAITGIIATFLYPLMRKKLGLIRTGLFNAFFQIATLIPCIASIFVAGSPFYLLPENQAASGTSFEDTTVMTSNLTTFSSKNTTSVFAINATEGFTSSNTIDQMSTTESAFLQCPKTISPPSSYVSLSLLMSGIILARVGLWGFDLTITQLIQETVVEKDRGVFNGVQSSLNNFMDLLRYLFVLVLPWPEQFGILIILSSAFVCIGYILYMVHAKKVRKHILPHCSKRPVMVADPS